MFDISEPIVQLLGIGLTSDGSSSLSADSSVTATAIVVLVESVSLSAESNVSASAVLVLVAGASLSGESDLTAGILQAWDASADLSVELDLTATVGLIQLAASLVVGSSNLTAALSTIKDAVARTMNLGVVGTFTVLVGHPVHGRPFVASSALTATIYTNPRLLVLPTVEYAYTNNVLLERYPIDNGRSLLITSGVGEIGDFFAQEQIRLADYYFGGGRRHELTPTEEAAVVAAGYGDLIVTEFL